MNLIQTKQVQDLDQTFINLSGSLDATGQILYEFLSGDTVFSGTKTFTGLAIFNDGIRVNGNITGGIGLFEQVGINLDGGDLPNERLHVSGANLLIQKDSSLTEGGTLYVSGASTTTGTVDISGLTNISGDTRVGGNITGEGNLTISGGYLPVWSGAPVSYNSPGTAGATAFDDSYFYVCTGANAWSRSAISAWP